LVSKDAQGKDEMNPAEMGITFNDLGGVIKIDSITKKTIDPFKKHAIKAVGSNDPGKTETSEAFK